MDVSHENMNFHLNEIEHKYGDNVHILSDPVISTYLARLCDRNTIQPEINRLVRLLYEHLIMTVAANEFPRKKTKIETRMIEYTERAVLETEVIDPNTPVVIASMARAGLLPGQVCFDELTYMLDGNKVRIDYFGIGRVVDNEQRVKGASVTYSKVGGPFHNAVLLIPDPMGATGGSVVETFHTYQKEVPDTPQKIIAMHLIITPEYLRRVLKEIPGIIVYAARLDRGMSDEEVLKTIPGTYPDREFGLTPNHYIVPGAGGLGEIITNAFV